MEAAREINCREDPAKVIAVLTSNLRLSCSRTVPRCIAHDFDSREFRFLFRASGGNECVRLERKENKNEELFRSFFGNNSFRLRDSDAFFSPRQTTVSRVYSP